VKKYFGFALIFLETCDEAVAFYKFFSFLFSPIRVSCHIRSNQETLQTILSRTVKKGIAKKDSSYSWMAINYDTTVWGGAKFIQVW
jgi:hypothetical protein